MKALFLNKVNEPLRYDDKPNPTLVENYAIVDIKAAALNHRDVWITKGMYPNIREGVILGSDGCGIYEGESVIINPNNDWGNNPKVQGRNYHILGLPTDGTFAEKVLVKKDKIHAKPSHLSFEEAAALPLGGMTAYRALFTRAGLQKGERVFISGVGGGVALFAFQFALAAGAEVWVSSGSDEKIQKSIEMGAKGGVNYKNVDWKSFAKKEGGFDVIIDSAGGEGFNNLIRVANSGGRICFYGGTRGNIPSLNPQKIFWKQLSILGSTMGTDNDFKNMLDFVCQNAIVPVVDSVFPLEEGQKAFDRMDKGLQFGKIVLTMGVSRD